MNKLCPGENYIWRQEILSRGDFVRLPRIRSSVIQLASQLRQLSARVFCRHGYQMNKSPSRRPKTSRSELGEKIAKEGEQNRAGKASRGGGGDQTGRGCDLMSHQDVTWHWLICLIREKLLQEWKATETSSLRPIISSFQDINSCEL